MRSNVFALFPGLKSPFFRTLDGLVQARETPILADGRRVAILFPAIFVSPRNLVSSPHQPRQPAQPRRLSLPRSSLCSKGAHGLCGVGPLLIKFSVGSREGTPAKASNIKACYWVSRAVATTKNVLSFKTHVTQRPAPDRTMRHRLDPARELRTQGG